MPVGQGRTADRESDIGQAPGDLGKLQAFVNTLDIEQGTDELATPAGLDRWLRQAGLADPGSSATPRDLARAVELREALRGVLRSHVLHQPAHHQPAHDLPAHDLPARITAIAAPTQAAIRADPDGTIRLVAAGSGSPAGLTRLLLIAAEAATLGTWGRLKVCSADACQWAFYDRSPTRNGCWCSMQICGARAKSRAYRSRSAQAR